MLNLFGPGRLRNLKICKKHENLKKVVRETTYLEAEISGGIS